MTTAQQLPTIAIEAMQVGHRYVKTIAPQYNEGWQVATVEMHHADLQVLRAGQWITPELVTVTYRNGQSITDETGTEIAIDCDEV